jgi:hypothetical protein
MGNQNRQGWNELSNALSFGGTTHHKKTTAIETTQEEREAMWRNMNSAEIKEVLHYDTEKNKERFHELRVAFYRTPSKTGRLVMNDGIGCENYYALNGNQSWQEAMIVLQNEKGASQ